MASRIQQQRRYVNEGFAKEASGKSLTNSQRSKILKRLWREAKAKYK